MSWKKITLPRAWDFGKEDTLEGYYESLEENFGENNSNFYTIRLADGDLAGMWGSTVLDGQMKRIKFGDKIKIQFLGMEDSPNRKGKQYKNFTVERWEEE